MAWRRSISKGSPSFLRYAAQLSRASSCVFCVALVDRARSLAPSPGAATFLSVPRRRPSLRSSAVRVWVRARSSTPSIFHPPSPCHSMRVQPCRFGRTSDRGREGGPCRRCSPSSSLNTAAILLPDQVRSRRSLVCSLGWMERREEGTWNKWSPLTRSLFLLLPPPSLSSLSRALFLRAPAATLPLPCSLARGATSCIHSAPLSPPRGVAWEREHAQLLVLCVARPSYFPPTRERLPKKVSHAARTMEPVVVGS